MSWFYKTSNPSMIQLPFLPSFPAVPASLCSYDLIGVLPSLSKQVVKLLLGAGQVFSCCQPHTDELLSEMCGFGTSFGMARPLVQWPWVEGREQPILFLLQSALLLKLCLSWDKNEIKKKTKRLQRITQTDKEA